MQSANNVAATKCIKACRYGQEVQLFSRPNVKCDPSNFDLGMIIGARQGCLSISETGDLGFSHTVIEFAENGGKIKKHPVSSSSGIKNSS